MDNRCGGGRGAGEEPSERSKTQLERSKPGKSQAVSAALAIGEETGEETFTLVQAGEIRCLLDVDRPARLRARLDLGHEDAQDAVGVLGRHCILADGGLRASAGVPTNDHPRRARETHRELQTAREGAIEALAEPGRGLVLDGGLGEGGVSRVVCGRLGGSRVVLLATEGERTTGVIDR